MQLRNKTRQRKNVYDGENAIPQVAKPTAQKKKKNHRTVVPFVTPTYRKTPEINPTSKGRG